MKQSQVLWKITIHFKRKVVHWPNPKLKSFDMTTNLTVLISDKFHENLRDGYLIAKYLAGSSIEVLRSTG